MPSNMYSNFRTGTGGAIPVNPSTGALNLNALIQGMVSRDIWQYYYRLKVGAGQQLAAQYNLFNAASGSLDPYPLTGVTSPVLTYVETNMPSTSSNGFAAPRDLILDSIGFFFHSDGCGLDNSAIGTFAAVADMLAFCTYSYYEFKIIDKIFSEGKLEMQPAGQGFTGMSTQQLVGVWLNGIGSPNAVNRMNQFAKYLAPLMPWSLTIFFPSGSGPGTTPAAPVLLTQAKGGNGLVLDSIFKGLTDRAVQ